MPDEQDFLPHGQHGRKKIDILLRRYLRGFHLRAAAHGAVKGGAVKAGGVGAGLLLAAHKKGERDGGDIALL